MAKKKLKTMNEISAAEAVKLFHQYADIFQLAHHEAEETQKKIHAAIISVNGIWEATYTPYMNPAGFPNPRASPRHCPTRQPLN